MAEYKYATLEEAFGIKSFLAPEPPVLRGDVAQISDARYAKLDTDIQKSFESSMGTRRTVQPPRPPLEATKCGVSEIAAAHAQGGARAAWDIVPECARCDMMWYAVREMFKSDLVIMALVATCLYLLLR
jgi:hypothetical protein